MGPAPSPAPAPAPAPIVSSPASSPLLHDGAHVPHFLGLAGLHRGGVGRRARAADVFVAAVGPVNAEAQLEHVALLDVVRGVLEHAVWLSALPVLCVETADLRAGAEREHPTANPRVGAGGARAGKRMGR